MKTIPVFTALTLSVLTVAGSVLFTAPRAEAHCQVPCGIFGDELKFAELSQHIDTMEKAMVQIVGLADSDDPDNQQKLIR
ncbi:MAG: superoxide dismutase [Ni], partial [Planctomycetota bacterium]